MNTSIIYHAEQYFAKLWEDEERQWKTGNISAVEMRNGAIIPVEYCL